jgi:hypothetical protein
MDTANNQAASANIRLRWNSRPDSHLYVIYTAGQRALPVWPGGVLVCRGKDLLVDSQRQGAIPFDAPKIETIKLNHRGPRCTFEAIIEDYAITDSTVERLGLIVRAADVKGQEDVAAEGIGLRSIAHGFAALGLQTKTDLRASSLSMMPCSHTYKAFKTRQSEPTSKSR